ncbi:MAG: hypothetical protein KJ077_30005 [Anaerolineae bacterium]|nr:hypothetical protein [Anaerolineae bacterium]
MKSGGGLSLKIFEVDAKIVLDEFLLEAKVKTVGALDDNLNNQDYNYLTVLSGLATPWRQANPLKPIRYKEAYLKMEDIYLVYPVEPAVQVKVKLMPHLERGIFYMGQFAIQANLSMGQEMSLGGAVDALTKRFLSLTDVSIFPMFPAKNVDLPPVMSVALLNRAKISYYHPAEV